MVLALPLCCRIHPPLVRLLQIEKPLPPPVYPGKPRGQNVEHPSTIGYVRGETGTISLDVTRLHPAMAGKVWVKAPNVQIDDPRIAHPSALGYRVDLNAQGCDMDFSRFNPVFVAPGMTVDTTPPPPPEPRPLIPLKAASAEGKYLEEKVRHSASCVSGDMMCSFDCESVGLIGPATDNASSALRQHFICRCGQLWRLAWKRC